MASAYTQNLFSGFGAVAMPGSTPLSVVPTVQQAQDPQPPPMASMRGGAAQGTAVMMKRKSQGRKGAGRMAKPRKTTRRKGAGWMQSAAKRAAIAPGMPAYAMYKAATRR